MVAGRTWLPEAKEAYSWDSLLQGSDQEGDKKGWPILLKSSSCGPLSPVKFTFSKSPQAFRTEQTVGGLVYTVANHLRN